jgi:hypothetical protein
MKFTFLILLTFLFLGAYPQGKPGDTTRSSDTGRNATRNKTSDANKNDNPKASDAGVKPTAKTERSEDTTISQPNDAFSNWSKLIAVVGLLVIMGSVMAGIFSYVRNSQVFIGHNTIKLIGFVLLLPSICIVSLVSPSIINGAVLAALLGTIAGYVLSRNQENDADAGKTTSFNAGHKAATPSEVDTLKKQMEDLRKENETLKAKIAGA